jgi:DNA-binding protein
MPFIDLTKPEGQFCVHCEKPFQYKTKTKAIPNSDAKEVEIITAHPNCSKAVNKMERIKQRIAKVKKQLHDLRTAQLNLEFEMFLAGQNSISDETDEIFMILKEKEIL